MAKKNLDTDDLAAAMTAFAISFTAVFMSPRFQTPNEVLEALANELDEFSKHMPDTAASEALNTTVQMLLQSEPRT